jgi:hypothetical protein
MLLAAMMAMVLVTAAPAFAQTESGDASFSADISNLLGNQCVQIINQQNTGNVENNADIAQEQVVVQANIAAIVDGVDVLSTGDNTIEQSNTNEQNAEINQVGVVQTAFAVQDCMQELAIK